jgi:methyl-accepting chemotaxis protein
VRLELTHKFVIGHLLVAVVAILLPLVLEDVGIPMRASTFMTLGLCAGVGWLFSYQMTRSFRGLHRCTDRISRGDLTAEVDLQARQRFPDEMTHLARSIHGMLMSLRELVEHIQRAAEQVASFTQELSDSSHAVSRSNRDVAATMEMVAEGAVRQQEDIDSTQASIREITDAIRADSKAAHEAFSFVSEADQRATAGVEVSHRSVAKMQSLFEKADQAGQLVFRFDQKIRSVHRITEMINSVSEKTHLLSLNASIEAARAGDAGRGFSVVAEEIRRLAESAASSGKQIEDLVSQLEDESARISEVMREMGQGMGAGREDLDCIQVSLEQVRDAVQKASRRAETIFHQAEDSVGRAEQTLQEFNGIAKVATENVQATDEMRRSLATQTSGIEEMVHHVTQLFETSGRLGEVARRFRARPTDE